jgi:hypothetical protein
MSSIQGIWCHDASFNGLGQPHMALPFSVHMASLLGWLHLLPVASLGRWFTFLTSPTSMWYWSFRHAEFKSYGVMDVSIQISKEGLGN